MTPFQVLSALHGSSASAALDAWMRTRVFRSIHRNPNVSSIPGPENSVQLSSERTAQSGVPITPTPSTPLLLRHRRLAFLPRAQPSPTVGGGRTRRCRQFPQLRHFASLHLRRSPAPPWPSPPRDDGRRGPATEREGQGRARAEAERPDPGGRAPHPAPPHQRPRVSQLKAAMTNEVFRITWPGGEGDLRKVVVCIYGWGVYVFFDRADEVRTFECMSRHGQGPRLLGRFANDCVEPR